MTRKLSYSIQVRYIYNNRVETYHCVCTDKPATSLHFEYDWNQMTHYPTEEDKEETNLLVIHPASQIGDLPL